MREPHRAVLHMLVGEHYPYTYFAYLVSSIFVTGNRSSLKNTGLDVVTVGKDHFAEKRGG